CASCAILRSGCYYQIIPDSVVLRFLEFHSRINHMLEQAIERLSHVEPDVRFKAAQELGASKDQRAVELLIGVLPDENAKVQYAAVSGLVKLGNNSAAHPILDLLLADPDSRVWELLKLGIGTRLRAGLLDMVEAGDMAMADRLTEAIAGDGLDEQQQAFFIQ